MFLKYRDDILKEIKEKRKQCMDIIEPGRLSTEDYRFMAGKNLGLKEAEEIIFSVFKRLFVVKTMGEKEYVNEFDNR